MYAFTYDRPSSFADALKLVETGGQALAGGQTMLASMKQRLMQPEKLVDLRQIPELTGVSQEGDRLIIGAMTRHCDVEQNALVKQHIPALAALAGGIGDRQVRAMGTIGGSIANNDPAACYPSAALALGATIHTNTRTIAAEDFFQGMYATALENGELIKAVSFPIPKRASYAKFKQGASRYAMVGVFVADTAQGARVAVTGAANGVFRHDGLEAALSKNFAPEAIADVMVDPTGLNSDIHASAAYRAQLIKVQTGRAVAAALA
jgi:carbon-monoxide dehydrogenase medium subunit